VQKELGLKLDF